MSEKKNGNNPSTATQPGSAPVSNVQGAPATMTEQVEGHGPVAGVAEPSIEDRVKALEDQTQNLSAYVDRQFNTINTKLDTLIQLQPAIAAEKGKSPAAATGPQQMTEKEWDTEYINNLPDNAFAVISSGGEKEEGKTVPRTLRHLPHHKSDGTLDLSHLRNALARLPQTEISAEAKAEAKRHLCAHAKDSEIVSDVCGEKPPEQSQEKGSGPTQTHEKAPPAPTGQGITKPVGELPPTQPGTIAVTEIRKVFDDARLFTSQLREKAILRLISEKEDDKA